MKEYTFQSKRLGFRPWIDSDLDPFEKINADADVMEFFVNVRTREETQHLISRIKEHFNKYGYGFYAIETLANKEFIGFIGLMNTKFDVFFCPCVEIGWRLTKSRWGQGFATEGARACLDHGMKVLNLKQIHSFTATINKKSERIMQKAGMTKLGEFMHPNVEDGHKLKPHVVYRIG